VRRRGALAALALGLVALGAVLVLVRTPGNEPKTGAPHPPRTETRPQRPPKSPALQLPGGPSLAIGVTETNPALLWSRDSGVDVGPFAAWRDRLAALRPRYLRVLVDWALLQPRPDVDPFDVAIDGCSRDEPPCRATGGLREILRAARSQQRDGAGFDVVLVIYGVPAWAARPPSGCERRGTEAYSRPITPAGLEGYRALVRGLVALGRQEGVPLRWWSPWNEPNGSYFLSPQRARCEPDAPLVSPAIYTTLFRTMRDELRAAGGEQHLLLGDLAAGPLNGRMSTSAPEFLAALPDDVVCGADVMSQHAYTRRGLGAARPDVVAAVEAVLRRRACAADMPLWLTEVGVGGPSPGKGRTDGAAGARADCRVLAGDLRRWWSDPRIIAAFQYSFRDDPRFPVGLVDARLRHPWPTLDLLEAWGGSRPTQAPPPTLPAACRG